LPTPSPGRINILDICFYELNTKNDYFTLADTSTHLNLSVDL